MSLQPAAGAHGEWAGLRMIQAFHEDRGDERTEVLVPDSAHGTNPASAALCGFKVVEVKSAPDGRVSLPDLEAKLNERTAALMLTNPNTVGTFEKDILEIARLVHTVGAKLYYDGANLNALMGICRPGDMGFDVVHLNLHKTFTTPHGGGGPGAGPVASKRSWSPSCPHPWSAGPTASSNSTTTGRSRSAGCAASTATSACWCALSPTSWRWAATG
jgi:glycine dehydrogenase subunit 2